MINCKKQPADPTLLHDNSEARNNIEQTERVRAKEATPQYAAESAGEWAIARSLSLLFLKAERRRETVAGDE